jgi:hypothetical protein
MRRFGRCRFLALVPRHAFLTDVLWGVLLGVGCVVMAARAILYPRERQRSELFRSA